MNDFELSINPVETYKAPEIPMLGGDNQKLLKKLPSRWKKNAKVMACFGLIGTFALSGCTYPFAQNPENNICFARVDIMSGDARVATYDIAPRWFPMNNVITCGSWVDANMLERRIADSRRRGRNWATVGGAVGGAAVGVGVMELFGNQALAGMGVTSVMGQRALSGDELIRSQMLTASNRECENFKNDLRALRDECRQWDRLGQPPIPQCTRHDIDFLLGVTCPA